MTTVLAFVCSKDSGKLGRDPTSGQMTCAICGCSYAVEQGVLRLLGDTNDFYEGTYLNEVRFIPRSEHIWHAWPLWLINSGYVWTTRHFVQSGSTVVELGCAGGVRYFGRRYRMVGCDISFTSLAGSSGEYAHRVQVDAAALIPIATGTVDAVVSSYFWEHMTTAQKTNILTECHRILRAGGRLIFLYDVETENPLIAPYKRRDAAEYERLFLDGDGHVGYETPAMNRERFRKAGFRMLRHYGMEKTHLQSPSVYLKLQVFGGEEAKGSRLVNFIAKAPWLFFWSALLRVVDISIGRLLPDRWSRIALTVCERD